MGDKKEKSVLIRMEPALHAEFEAAIATEAAMHDFENRGVASKVRELIREFNQRVRSTSESEAGRAAAKVLRKAPKRARA